MVLATNILNDRLLMIYMKVDVIILDSDLT